MTGAAFPEQGRCGAPRPPVSIGIIAIRRTPELDQLLSRLVALCARLRAEVVVVVETTDADDPDEKPDGRGVRWVEIPVGRGLGYNRNRALEAARGDTVVFLDDDCEPQPGWLETLLEPLEDRSLDAVMGGVTVPSSTLLGDCISALGFPAGGSAGYETMFHVDADGLTDNLSTLNCAVRRAVFDEVGWFDESLTLGGEDTELAYRMVKAGKRILYHPAAQVTHPPRSSLSGFVRWFFRRGRAKYQFARKVPEVGVFVRRRMSSAGRLLWAHRFDPRIVIIAPLLAASLVLQQTGVIVEYWRGR